MIVFHKLCRTTWSLRGHRTESVSVMVYCCYHTVTSINQSINTHLHCVIHLCKATHGEGGTAEEGGLRAQAGGR